MPTPVINNNSITLSGGRIFLNGEEVSLPDKLIPPANFENDEAIYLAELLKAYAEVEKVQSMTPDNIPQKYKKEFERHRQDYFNAEAVHRRMRETYSSEQNDFETFKQETYDGIIDTHSMPYSLGYERLLKVLQQAVNLHQGKSLLWQLPKWIGSSEKKGVCHILVNDGEITWVVENE